MVSEIVQYIVAKELISVFICLALGAYWVYGTMQRFQRYGYSRGAYFSFFFLLIGIFFLFGFIIFPIFLSLKLLVLFDTQKKIMEYMSVGVIRWFFLYVTLVPAFFFSPYATDKLKSGITMLVHLTVVLMGWLFGKGLGVIFISAPILVVFYLFLYYLAQIIFPAREPNTTAEKHNKFLVFFWYIWGMQYPQWVSKNRATRYTDMRIEGKYLKPIGKPGVIWTHSHQVAVRSTGIEFVKVGKPGIIFTRQAERPTTIVDLRTQLRPRAFTAVTEDGIEINAVIFISFQIDRTDWDREAKHKFLRENPTLQEGVDVEKSAHINYPYSSARVRAALSVSSIDFWDNDSEAEEKHWDEVAVQRVLKVARLVLSGRKFDEIWVRAEGDNRRTGAIDEVSQEIGDIAKLELKKMGVQLFGSRIVNYIIDETSSLYQQLKASWLFAWDKKIERLKFEGEAEAERLKIDAKMSARQFFMETVSETLSQLQDIDSNLLRQLTALNFITTLDKLLEDVDKEDTEEQTARISAWGRFMSRSSRDR